MAVTFATTPTVTSAPTLSVGTPFWIGNFQGAGGATLKLYSDPGLSSVVDVTGTGTGTMSVINVGGGTVSGVTQGIRHFAHDTKRNYHFGIDDTGKVWTDAFGLTSSGYWVYSGNRVPSGSYTSGNGLVYYQASNGDGYVFAIHNSSIDIFNTNAASGVFSTPLTWNYQWNPAVGTVGTFSATPTPRVLHCGLTDGGISHEAMVSTSKYAYICDTEYLDSFNEQPTKIFLPTSPQTYAWTGFDANNNYALYIPGDNANCLTQLGTNLLIGGNKNIIYPWDRTSTSYSYPIFLSENVISKLVTVNTNTYAFIGNRGRIYVTNGSQAQLYKKIPDHISGTVEPYFTWGGATFARNQLYFSAKCTANDGTTPLNFYGGLWAIDLDTGAIRLTNKLTYGTYAGYATGMMAIVPTLGAPQNSGGIGMYIAWDSGASTYGIDSTTNTPYTGSQAVIESDLIPIGTYDKPRDMTRVEYRLSKPMVSGESVTLNYRLDFSQAWNQILTDSTVGNFSLSKEVNFKNAQWLQLQAVLNSTSSTPSFTRLREFRIRGIVPNG